MSPLELFTLNYLITCYCASCHNKVLTINIRLIVFIFWSLKLVAPTYTSEDKTMFQMIFFYFFLINDTFSGCQLGQMIYLIVKKNRKRKRKTHTEKMKGTYKHTEA